MIFYELLSPDNVNEVWELEKICFSDPWTLNMFTSEFNNKVSVYIVARDEDTNKVAGYGGIWLMYDFADITNIAIAPEYRREGLGSDILSKLEDIATDFKAETVTLEVRASNTPAIQLYKKNGFLENEVRKNYYRDNEDAIIMSKNLKRRNIDEDSCN